MKFDLILKNTLKSFKKAGAVFWILCSMAALFAGIGTLIQNISIIDINDSFTYEEVCSNHLDIGEPVYPLYNDFEISEFEDYEISESELEDEDYEISESELEDEDYEISEFEDFDIDYDMKDMISGISIGFNGFVITGVICIFGFILIIVVGGLYNYYLTCYAVEAVEDKKINKGKNALKAMMALTLYGLIVFAAIGIDLLLIFMGFVLEIPILIIPFVFIGIFAIMFISIRFGAIYYVSAKYENLSITGILGKASQIAKGNMWKIIGYTLLCSLIVSIVTGPIEFVLGILVAISPATFAIVDVVISTLIVLASISFGTLFNINMYKALDNSEEIDIEKKDVYNEDMVEINDIR